ncbi:hypothetical protein M9458_055530 [Cirrhinus mrigala]|uniref:Uncharacterized protein n=1 Tax=Cirrhinus mrigala TaxID=683832 RepID=A0ABD0MJ13_CIRMR
MSDLIVTSLCFLCSLWIIKDCSFHYVVVRLFLPETFLFPLCFHYESPTPSGIYPPSAEAGGSTARGIYRHVPTSSSHHQLPGRPACRAPSSEDGPRADFASFVEWTLARNRSSFPACSLENLASVSPDPDPNKPPPRPTEYQPEPTDDGELKPAATSEPSQKGATELLIVMEPELHEPSDQVREPATMTATVEISVEREIAEDSITHCTTAEAHHLCSGFAAGLPISIGVMAGGSLIFAFSLGVLDSISALRPCGSTPALSSLVSTVARRSNSSTGLHRPFGSAPVCHHPTIVSGFYSSGCASSLHPTGSVELLHPSGTASVLCRSGSAVDLRISVSALGSTTTCSASVGRPHGVASLSSTMAPPSIGSTVGFHHGCGLGFTWLLLLQPLPVTSLASPSVITSMDYSATTLDSIFCPPLGSPSSAEAPS